MRRVCGIRELGKVTRTLEDMNGSPCRPTLTLQSWPPKEYSVRGKNTFMSRMSKMEARWTYLIGPI